MDIMELSRKMEGDLLESNTGGSSYRKSFSNYKFSPRMTRSQAIINKKTVKDHPLTDLQIKRPRNKVSEVERIYLNKKPKVVHKNLETIYENPISKKGNTVLIGASKVKRSIYLDREFRVTSKVKAKLRKMKIKRLGKKIKPFKMTDEEFKCKMLRVENYINGNNIEFEDCNVEFENVEATNDNCIGFANGDSNEDCNEFENGDCNEDYQSIFENGDDVTFSGSDESHEREESISC